MHPFQMALRANFQADFGAFFGEKEPVESRAPIRDPNAPPRKRRKRTPSPEEEPEEVELEMTRSGRIRKKINTQARARSTHIITNMCKYV